MPTLFPSLAAFYASDARRFASPEVDVGLWWRDGTDGPTYRAAWVRDTGELYLLRHQDPDMGGGELEVLGRFDCRDQLEAAVRGFEHVCGDPRSAAWLRSRAATAPTRAPVG
jgi:hypothetical protein